MHIRNRSSCDSGSGKVPIWSCGFWVAMTKNGSGSGSVLPSIETWRSSMASSSADWVFGDARLISSASSTCENTGPGWKTNCALSRSNTDRPTMSAGNRSLVNCTRLNCRPSDIDSAWASVVLPTPGRSSISRWPRASRQARASLICGCLPTTTAPTCAATVWIRSGMGSLGVVGSGRVYTKGSPRPRDTVAGLDARRLAPIIGVGAAARGPPAGNGAPPAASPNIGGIAMSAVPQGAPSAQDEALVTVAHDGGVVRLTLNRPAQFNALSEGLMRALQAELERVAADPGARVVVLGGAGKAFCAGHDLRE